MLETRRLRLRPIERGDLRVLQALYGDEELMRFITGRPRTPRETRARMNKDVAHHRTFGFGLCVAEWKASGEAIGRCGLEPTPADAGLEGELAWMFARPWWGRGLATEAGAALISLGLGEFELSRVFARADPGNDASLRVMNKLGMTRVAADGGELEYEVRATVRLILSDPAWGSRFALESRLIAQCLGEDLVSTHHIGSTAIPGIFAKPIVDILVEVTNLEAVANIDKAMKRAGYEAMGEFGISGRRYFRKHDSQGTRTHQVHVFGSGNPELARHLDFRNYMLAHPRTAQEYSDLKRSLARAHPLDNEAYMDGKDSFIKHIDEELRFGRIRQPPD